MRQFVKGRYYVTVHGAESLRKEMDELEVKRAQVSQNIRTAKGFGDLKENFEYHEAKREGGFIEGRMQQLKIILPSLEVIAPEDVPVDTICFGSHVRLREDEMDEWEVLIVGPIEANPVEDRVSYESPLGAALLGKRAGEVFTAKVPAGELTYEILEIRPYER